MTQPNEIAPISDFCKISTNNVSVNFKPDHPPGQFFLMSEFPTPQAKKSSKPPPWAYKNELKPHLRGHFFQLFTLKA